MNGVWFDDTVARPSGLDRGIVLRAVEFAQRELKDWVEIYDEQKNLFSAIVGIVSIKALSSLSPFERHRHADIAQQRFPDLIRKGARRPPSADDCLEIKASTRPWALQSHYNHPGWYMVWRYLVDVTCTLEESSPVVIWRIDLVRLIESDWTYEGSRAGDGTGGRTHTFGLKNPSKRLAGTAVYRRADVRIVKGKPVPANGHG